MTLYEYAHDVGYPACTRLYPAMVHDCKRKCVRHATRENDAGTTSHRERLVPLRRSSAEIRSSAARAREEHER